MLLKILFSFILSCVSFSVTVANNKVLNYWDGESYRENAQLQAIWAYKFFFKNYEFLGNERILDIGCGDGKITAAIARLTPRGQVIGLDNSTSMLDIANKAYGKISNLIFIKEEATNLGFYNKEKNSFDIITSFSVLNWIQNQLLALQGINTVLKDGGKFFLRVTAKNGNPIKDIADKLMTSKEYQKEFVGFVDPLNRFNEQEYSELLIKAGFKNFSINDSKERDEFPSRQSAIKQIKSWLPHYHFLKNKNTTVAETFVENLMDLYLLEPEVKVNGKIILFDHYLEVMGEK